MTSSRTEGKGGATVGEMQENRKQERGDIQNEENM